MQKTRYDNINRNFIVKLLIEKSKHGSGDLQRAADGESAAVCPRAEWLHEGEEKGRRLSNIPRDSRPLSWEAYVSTCVRWMHGIKLGGTAEVLNAFVL